MLRPTSKLIPTFPNEIKLIIIRNNYIWTAFDFTEMFNPVNNITLLSSNLGF